MKTLKELCKKGGRYKEMIKESSIVKNAVILLGGRRKGNEGEKEGKEGEEGEEGRTEREEGKGGMEVECGEMNVGEKISLIELLSVLVKGEEEEMKEVLMELEEEGNKHVEEEIEGEGENEEEEEEEKREWEELSEKARNLVWVIESTKARREGRKNMSLKRMKKEKEEEKKKREDLEKKVEEVERRRRKATKKLKRMKMEMEEMRKEGVFYTQTSSDTPPTTPSPSNVITSLDRTSVIFPQSDGIKREGNIIIHHGSSSYRNCFIGGEMRSV